MRHVKYLAVALILVLSGVVYSNFAKVIRSTEILLGLNTDTDVTITADTLGTPDPFVKWNEVNQRWEFSNDGTTTKPLGAGKGIHQNILQDSNFDIEDKQTDPFTVTIDSNNLVLEQANPAFESTSLAWTPDAGSAESLLTELVAIPEGYYNKQCEARFFYKGGPAGMVFKVTDGTNTIVQRTLSQPGTFKEASILFVCPSSGNIQIQVDAPTTATTVFFDDFYIGEALDNIESSIATDWEAFTPSSSWSTNTTHSANWRRVGDEMEVRGRVDLTGAPDAAELTIILPNSHVIDTSKFPNDAEDATVGLANYHDIDAGLIESKGQRVRYRGNSNQVQLDSSNTPYSQTAPVTWASGDEIYYSFKVPIKGWSAKSDAAPLELQGWYIDASIAAVSPTPLTGSDFPDPTQVEASDYTLSKNNDSADVQITCALNNNSVGTTCDSIPADESLGITFDAPVAGVYKVCGSLTWRFFGVGQGYQNWELVETPENWDGAIGNIIQYGKERAYQSLNNTNEYERIKRCGTFKFTSKGRKTIRMTRRQEIVGSVSGHEMLVTSLQNAESHWVVTPMSPFMQAPLIRSSLNMAIGEERSFVKCAFQGQTSSAAPTLKVYGGEDSNGDGKGDCASTNTAVGPFTGNYYYSFKPGLFSADPICNCNCHFDAGICMLINPPTTAGGAVACRNYNGSLLSTPVQLQCVGPR